MGKSSFLAAGALPRLRKFTQPVYTRRDKTHKNGLAGQLADLQSQTAPGHLPPVFILDQAEEMFTDPLTGEQDALINEIGCLLQQDKNATVVMGFRSDFRLKLEDLLVRVDEKQEGMPLRPLTLAGITEAIEGVLLDKKLSRRYRLELEPHFASRVAADLIRTESGGIAAILQNRLLKLCEDVQKQRSNNQPVAVIRFQDYQTLASNSSAEKELLDFQINRLRNEKGVTEDDKFVYGALAEFVVEKATARSVAKAKITTDKELLDKFLQVNLLTELTDSEAIRLSHDLLAGEVYQRRMQAVQDENEQGKFKLVSIRMRDARQMIDNIDFEQAFNEYRETTHLDVLPDELWPTGFELAYIYLQAGKTQDGAYLLAETLKHLERADKLPERLQGLSLPDNTDTAAMLERLRQSEPEYYLKMQRRYFPNMIFIKGGTFNMGDIMDDGLKNSQPVHRVTLSDYELADTPQTWWQYGLYCFAAGLKLPSDGGFGRADRPVIHVSWDDAVKYSAWMSAYSGEKYGLPTEAEWEFAARERGRKVRFGNGKDVADEAEINFDASIDYVYSVNGNNRGKTTPVKTFLPNAIGLFDMSGNVWEWCLDGFYDYSSDSQINPAGPARDSSCVIRGGSWNLRPQSCVVVNRDGYLPTGRSSVVGFRLARIK